MKKTRSTKQKGKSDEDLAAEYLFDYRKGRPNRFAAHIKQGSRVVVIEPDVAKIFATPDSINAVLRALIETMPRTKSGSNGRGRTNG